MNCKLIMFYIKSIVCCFLILASTFIQAQTVNIYVSPTGASTGNGASITNPITLAQARVVAKSNANVPCTIWLLDGNYRTNRIVLDATDARTVNAPLNYRAVNQHKAIFQPINLLSRTDFQPIPDSIKARIINTTAKSKVVQLNLTNYNLSNMNVWPNAFETGTVRWPIFYSDSNILPMSQYPNDTGLMRIRTVLTNGSNRSVPGGSFKYRDDRGKFWDKAVRDGLWLKGNWRVPWQISFIKTLSISTVDSIIVQTVGVNGGIGDKYTQPAGNGKEPYVAINLVEEIDKEGEWAINFSTKMLYMWLPENGQLSYASDHLAYPISLTNVNYVNIEGIAIKSGASDGMFLSNCNNVTIAGADISYCSGNAISIIGGSNCEVKSCNLYELGQGGVIVAPASTAAFNADQLLLKPCNHRVVNNHIYNFAKEVAIYSAAINLKTVIGAYAANNKIHGTPHVGILYDGNNNVMEYNELFDIIRTYEDMGAFYRATGPKSRGNKIRYNYVHDSPLGKSTFYDNGSQGDSSSYNIDANNLYGMQNNGGYFNTYTNSIVINNNPATNINVTIDTDPSFKPFYDSLKSIYNASAVYRSAYPEVADMVANATINKAYTSRIWPRLTCNVFISNTQVIRNVSDASLFNTDGTTNSTYAQTQHPFTSYRFVVANNLKLSGILRNPIKPFLIDSLKRTGAFARTCSTDWRLHRIGLYTDSFRTTLTNNQIIQGIKPEISTTVTSNNNFTFPTTLTLRVKAKNPNIARCISSVKFFDNGSEITSINPTVLVSSFDSVVYTVNWLSATPGNHSITAVVYDAPNWQFATTPININIVGSLPLQLISFTAQQNECKTQLQWVTNNEVNVQQFQLQTSKDGIQFQVLQNIAAQCNQENKKCNYSTTILQPEPAFYRLKMIDATGDFTYSKTLSLSNHCYQNQRIKVYPNPVKSQLTFLYQHIGASTKANLLITNEIGKIVSTQVIPIYNGINTIHLPTFHLSNGVYLLQIAPHNNKFITQTKFIVNKE